MVLVKAVMNDDRRSTHLYWYLSIYLSSSPSSSWHCLSHCSRSIAFTFFCNLRIEWRIILESCVNSVLFFFFLFVRSFLFILSSMLLLDHILPRKYRLSVVVVVLALFSFFLYTFLVHTSTLMHALHLLGF